MTARILAAAQKEFELVGIRRSSMSDVARRAGISRAAVYRRYPGKDSLVKAVAGREMLAVLARVAATVSVAPDAAGTVVQLAVASARELRSNPLLLKLLETEPEELYNYGATSGDTSLPIVRMFIVQYLQSLRDRDRLLPEADLAMAAEIMIRLATTQLLMPGGLMPFRDDAGVAEFARRYFVPLVVREIPATA
ncbi:TetR/AcrR family transcriptional regulator [Antrihabitans stalagmiti]|uniref:TetR/AcrR family transcriptional regulator n=1 Tax=Antrihabitans stalagmiti TaxID=2799499 RepID=UPI0018F4F472|nr:TetR/AcrR family transcriptional regulator [Antrihabitans stalagmiti]